MNESDFDEFCALLDGVCNLLSRGAYQPNAASSALFFRSMQDYPLATVRKALEAHMADPQRGRFVPVPADLIAQIEGSASDDGRPGAEEAWAIAVRAADEAATIVWTDDMAQAWGACRSVMALGDEIGARMAFKEAYGRLVADARKQHQPVRWTPTLGHDLKRRHEVLARAEAAGLLPMGEALRLAPPTAVVDGAMALLLETSAKRQADPTKPVDDPDEIRRRAQALRAALIRPEHDPKVSEREHAALQQRKDAQRARVAEYLRQNPEVASAEPVGERTPA